MNFPIPHEKFLNRCISLTEELSRFLRFSPHPLFDPHRHIRTLIKKAVFERPNPHKMAENCN